MLAVGAAFRPGLVPVWRVLGLAPGGLALADLIALARLPTPLLKRRVGHTLPLGVWNPVRLTLDNAHGQALRLDLFDCTPLSSPAVACPGHCAWVRGNGCA
jgi:hypothetical protein